MFSCTKDSLNARVSSLIPQKNGADAKGGELKPECGSPQTSRLWPFPKTFGTSPRSAQEYNFPLLLPSLTVQECLLETMQFRQRNRAYEGARFPTSALWAHRVPNRLIDSVVRSAECHIPIMRLLRPYPSFVRDSFRFADNPEVISPPRRSPLHEASVLGSTCSCQNRHPLTR